MENTKHWIGYRLKNLCLLEPKPEPRQGHVMMNIGDGRFFLFGGRGTSKVDWKTATKHQRQQRQQSGKRRQRRYLNDTWMLDIRKEKWEKIDCDARPTARWSTASFYDDSAVYIHGGRSLDSFHDDLWKFDLESQTWRLLVTTGRSPPAVNGHSMVSQHGTGLVYLFGCSYSFGREAKYLGDTYMFALDTLQWTKLNCKGPSPRYWHSATVQHDRYWYLVGGFAFEDDRQAHYFEDAWRLTWRRTSGMK